MTTKAELEQQVQQLKAKLDAMTARAERAELGVPASTLDVVGYWVFDKDKPQELWDGELHLSLREAEKVLADARKHTGDWYRESDTEGLAVYQMRPVSLGR